MELREVDAIANKRDYADACIYVKQVESINLAQLYRALSAYLSFLILPQSEQYLSVYQAHLADPCSWLGKAQLLSQAETQRELARTRARSAASAFDQVLWEDTGKKLNYLIEGWDVDIYPACQQIVQGISMLINEHIPLNEVQGEIIEFAEGRGVFPPESATEESVTQALGRLLCDAKINASSVLVKLSRTVAVQADLFLNRLLQTAVSFEHWDTRQSFLFEANYKLCEFVEAQSQQLRASLNVFSDKLAERVAMRLDRIAVDAVLQRYEACVAPSSAIQEAYFTEEKVDVEEEGDAWDADEAEAAENMVSEPVIQTASITTSLPGVTYEKLEDMLAASEQLLESVIAQVSLHRLQLSCSSRVKACYAKFSLFPLFRQIATKLTQYQTALSHSLSGLTEADGMAEIAEESAQRLSAVVKALENSLARVKTYLNTLNVHHEDYSVTDEIPNWQSKLHDLILGSSEAELVMVDSRLQRIEAMDSPYLRATLLMKLDSAKLKLNDMIIANMQSWSSRFVDRDTVVDTLGYLGIRIHPSHLNKIAPNIRIVKKRVGAKKDFYSHAADYGMAAWKNVRAWLDKQAIN